MPLNADATLGTPGLSGALAIWLCNGLIITLILTRLGLRFFPLRLVHPCLHPRLHPPVPHTSTGTSSSSAFTTGDYFLLTALVFHEIRVVGDYYMNRSGTPLSVSMDSLIDGWAQILLTEDEQSDLILAGKMMVVSRIAIIIMLWSLKISLLSTLNTFLPPSLGGKQSCIKFTSAILAITFSASFLSIFLECKPFELNWTLFPGVTQCSFDVTWIVTYEICNIITDTILLFLPFLLVLGSPIHRWSKPQLPIARLLGMLVFTLGGALITVEIVRLAEGLAFKNILLNRIVWGSIEAALATTVATWPSILLQIGLEGKQEPSEDDELRDMGASFVAPRPNEEVGHQGSYELRQPATLEDDDAQARGNRGNTPQEDTPISKETGQESLRQRPATWNATQSSVIGSILDAVLSEAKDRDSWPRPGSVLRNPRRCSRAGSRQSMGMQGADDNLPDTFSRWIELEETNAGSVFNERCSVTPDMEGYKSVEILVAREISQVPRRVGEPGQQPRLITIPKRARLRDCPEE